MEKVPQEGKFSESEIELLHEQMRVIIGGDIWPEEELLEVMKKFLADRGFAAKEEDLRRLILELPRTTPEEFQKKIEAIALSH